MQARLRWAGARLLHITLCPTVRHCASRCLCSILLGGLAGGLLGYGLVDTQCTGACSVQTGSGMLICSLIGAGGTAIVAVLVLRAHGEWRDISDPT